jgi:hypothetical protein
MGVGAPGQPTLVDPEEWVVDKIVRERLDRQLARAPREVV